jgi:hypothetical protein
MGALRVIETAAKSAGVEDVGVHTLRHSAAVAWLEQGVHIAHRCLEPLRHGGIAGLGEQVEARLTGLSALPLLLYRLGATAGQRGQSRRWWRTRRRPTVRGLCWRRPRPATLRPVRLMPHICNSANRHSDDLRLLPGVRGSGSQGRRRRRMGSGAV